MLIPTHYSMDSSHAEALRAKGLPFLQKPFSIRGLAKKVREIMEGEGKF